MERRLNSVKDLPIFIHHSYKEILAGRGFGLKDARQSVETAYTIRNATPVGLKGDYHPILKTI